ncbi:hypothetical protein SERLA73DRAFT_113060 [Serpula lacrymans var. lacrymans S7.3]|uniref:Chromatin assembly factor 1 subunit A dimerization domain-containing protein n=1 Tax=Serpula lacrymans var. lacrymans (strain S7.3) TaxID=936435 RepID=F8Q7F0_SERL3|nr:hypothetical protein SERLA73DRAFT_113060 [Serpula lacrymans var. lacrymans S7.3]
MQEIVKFREMLDQRIEKQELPLATIPDDYKSLIVKLAHESDKAVTALAKHIHHELLPAHDEDEDSSERAKIASALPLSVVEHAIKSIMSRNNYGLDGPLGYKLPPSLCVWRWEVKDEYRDWLPKSGKEKAEARLTERMQAKKELNALFQSLPQDERDSIMDPKGTHKLPTKDINKGDAPPHPEVIIIEDDSDLKDSDGIQSNKNSEETENIAQPGDMTPKTRSKKATDLEKAAKAKERQEKLVAKAEKEKREKDAQNKSRSLMANFFGKVRGTESKLPPREANASAGPSSAESDFQKTFKPFVLKKDAEIAPVNWFLECRKKRSSKGNVMKDYGDVIVIEDEDEHATDKEDPDVEKAGRTERLQSTLKSMASLRHPSHMPPKSLNFKTFRPHNTRDIVSLLNEAEIAGDPAQVRSLLSVLRNRNILPAKVLIFEGDARPGYYGTWTRNSRVIGPRTPFARDMLVLDYGYDSGEEWEAEAPGDADDVVEDGEEDDNDGDDADSDLESWLVDDDDMEDIGTPDEDLDSSPMPMSIDIPMPPPKRKTEAPEKKMGKKRKVVIPLVPYAKGPCWESTIGWCEYDAFRPYRVQLFNDTPYPIDPFTFVSKSVEEQTAPPNHDIAFVVPPLPDHVLASTVVAGPSKPTSSTSAMKRMTSIPTPKTAFPDAHIPLLLSKISSVATGNINFLVESVFQELRTHKVKKNAIEAKVKELGEKSKEKKIWVVKEDVRVSPPFAHVDNMSMSLTLKQALYAQS